MGFKPPRLNYAMSSQIVEVICIRNLYHMLYIPHKQGGKYEGWNFNGGNYLFTTDTK